MNVLFLKMISPQRFNNLRVNSNIGQDCREAISQIGSRSGNKRTTYAIDKDTPIPRHGVWSFPFMQMEPGDSFFADLTYSQQLIAYYARLVERRTGRKFIVRTVPGGYRCWRYETKNDGRNYKIENTIPVPTEYKPNPYPFHLMEVGDSFYVEGDPKTIANLYCKCGYYGRKLNTKYKVCRLGRGFRCWRTV